MSNMKEIASEIAEATAKLRDAAAFLRKNGNLTSAERATLYAAMEIAKAKQDEIGGAEEVKTESAAKQADKAEVPENHGKPWADSDLALIKKYIDLDRLDPVKAGKKLKRKPMSIATQANKMGYKDKSWARQFSDNALAASA